MRPLQAAGLLLQDGVCCYVLRPVLRQLMLLSASISSPGLPCLSCQLAGAAVCCVLLCAEACAALAAAAFCLRLLT